MTGCARCRGCGFLPGKGDSVRYCIECNPAGKGTTYMGAALPAGKLCCFKCKGSGAGTLTYKQIEITPTKA
ncbi:Hypothetical protein POVN_LOCUS98 [uncultured virus]|nr:Hypothetical protein POVN_LOCUS98 [uncultured virus]